MNSKRSLFGYGTYTPIFENEQYITLFREIPAGNIQSDCWHTFHLFVQPRSIQQKVIR
jgi:hypothetical protein